MAVRGRLLYAATVGERGKGCFAAWSCAFLVGSSRLQILRCAALPQLLGGRQSHSLQLLPAGAW
jgi:hypothetical protein